MSVPVAGSYPRGQDKAHMEALVPFPNHQTALEGAKRVVAEWRRLRVRLELLGPSDQMLLAAVEALEEQEARA